MKTSSIGVILAVALVGFLNTGSVSAIEAEGGEQDGLTLLVESIRYAGYNPKIVRSGRVLLTVTRKSGGISEEQFRHTLDAHKETLKKRIASFPENDRNRQLFAKQLETAEKDLRRVQTGLNSQNYRCQIVFSTAYGQFQDVKQILYSHASSKPDAWEEQYVLVGGQKDVRTSNYLQLFSDRKEIRVECNKWGVDHIFEFGRIRGERATTLTVLLLLKPDKTVNWNYEFNEEAVRVIRRWNRALQADKIDTGIRVVGTTKFEGGNISIVEASLAGVQHGSAAINVGGKWVVWIDPSRGYICPRIEEYVGTTLRHLYLSRGYYLDQKSGLWWPRNHVDTKFSPTGDVQQETTYEMSPEATALNVPVDPKEYVLPTQVGFHVIDNRASTPSYYMVARPTDLRLTKGEIDLTDDKTFMPDQPLLATILKRSSGRPQSFAICFFLLFLFSFILYWRHRKRATT